MYTITAFTLLLLSNTVCLPTQGRPLAFTAPGDSLSTSASHNVRDLHTFELGTWVENLLVRPSGRILATVYTPLPEIYEIDPHSRQTSLVATLPGVSNLLGIAEGPRSETVYVVGEDFPVTTLEGVKGSNSIYELDLRDFDASHGSRKAGVKLALRVANATALNGLAPVNAAERTYVATDFGAGSIYLLNLMTGQSKVIVENEWTEKQAGAAGGADGIKVKDGYIYWTTFSANVFARIPIDDSGTPTGAPEELVDIFSDDFCFGPQREAYLTMPGQNSIGIWRPGQKLISMLPGTVYGPTAVQLGLDGTSLIVTTSGNDTQYPDHITRPGKVVELRL